MSSVNKLTDLRDLFTLSGSFIYEQVMGCNMVKCSIIWKRNFSQRAEIFSLLGENVSCQTEQPERGEAVAPPCAISQFSNKYLCKIELRWFSYAALN